MLLDRPYDLAATATAAELPTRTSVETPINAIASPAPMAGNADSSNGVLATRALAAVATTPAAVSKPGATLLHYPVALTRYDVSPLSDTG